MNAPGFRMLAASLVWACGCFEALGGPASTPPQPADPRHLLPDDAFVRSALKRWVDRDRRSPGIAVGIVDASGARVIAYGQSGNGSRPQVDGDTLFEIGSITKTFTTTLLVEMIHRGEVRLDDGLRQCLPAGMHLPPFGAGDITLRQLATHSSGLPRIPADDPAFLFSMVRSFRNPYRHYSRKQLFAYLERVHIDPASPRAVEYSNLGVGLLGEALAQKAGRQYGELLRARVLEPLAMTNTYVDVPMDRQSLFATGHRGKRRPVSHWDLPALAGAGALRSSVRDMLKYLAANLNHTAPV